MRPKGGYPKREIPGGFYVYLFWIAIFIYLVIFWWRHK